MNDLSSNKILIRLASTKRKSSMISLTYLNHLFLREFSPDLEVPWFLETRNEDVVAFSNCDGLYGPNMDKLNE